MKNFQGKIDRFTKANYLLIPAICLLVANLTIGCASSSETHVKKETVSSPTAQTQTVVTEKETTKTESSEHHGVIGDVFHVVGEVLAFPFQLVADVFRFIF